MTTSDKEQAENLLTELLLAGLRAPIHIKGAIADLAIGVADLLEPEQIERAKEYAQYRYHGNRE